MLKDLQQNTQMYIDLYNTSLVSQETAIGQIFSRDATMVQQEVDRIKQEQDERQQKQIELNNSQQNIKPPLPSKPSNGNH